MIASVVNGDHMLPSEEIVAAPRSTGRLKSHVFSYYFKAKLLTALLLGAFGSPAVAYTDCPATKVSQVLAIDAGSVSVWFASGIIGYQAASGGSAQGIMALATTALATNRTVSARYLADGVNCAVGGFRSDLIGLYLNG